MAKLFAIAIIAGILTAQVIAIVPPGRTFFGSWYWPFLNYPMYANAHPRGAVVTTHELWGRMCLERETAVRIDADRLNMPLHAYLRLVRYAGAPGSADPRARGTAPEFTMEARAQLSRLSVAFAPEICVLEVRERSAPIGAGVDYRTAPWRRIRAWETADFAAAADGAPPQP